MIRLLFFFLFILALGFGFAWLADRPGDMVITWQGQRIEMSLMVATTILVSIIAAIMLIWWFIRVIWTSPNSVARYFRARKRDRGYQALSTGLIAAGAGDAEAARRLSKRAQGLIKSDQEPLIHLLDAQAALIEGKHEEARLKFEQMAEDPETRDLALRGLYLEATRLGADEAAKHYAERAAEVSPHLPWAARAALEYTSRDGNWDDALRLLEKQRIAKVLSQDEADRKKAVLLTARAKERLDADPHGAREDAQTAFKLSSDLVPAAVIAAKALFREESLRRGSRILEKSWKSGPHPEVAHAYVRARSGDSVTDRLKRAQKLEALKANNVESLIAVAHAALDASQYELARAKAEAAARQQPREGIFLLLADIEEAETGDQGRVRYWLSQAVRAPRDPAWTADGYVSDTWEAVSPITGKLDAFQWKTPVERLAGPVEEGTASTAAAADKAIRALPPVAAREPAEAASPEEPEPAEEPAPVEIIPPAAKAKPEPEPEPEPKAEAKPEPEPKPEPKPEPVEPAAEEPEKKPEEPVVEPAGQAQEKPAEAEAESKPASGEDDAKPESEPDKAKSDLAPVAGNGAAQDDATSPDDQDETGFHNRRPDDPGVDGDGEQERKPRFRLF